METQINSMADRPGSKRIIEIDGLRGLAIFLVVIWHYFYFGPAPNHHSIGLLRNLYVSFERCIALGYTGVDLFFVLSGFLIGGILLDNQKSPSYFRTFYIRRFYRIIPIYYTWIVCYLVLMALGGAFLYSRIRGTAGSISWPQIVATFLFIQNLGFIRYMGLGGLLVRGDVVPGGGRAVLPDFASGGAAVFAGAFYMCCWAWLSSWRLCSAFWCITIIMEAAILIPLTY